MRTIGLLLVVVGVVILLMRGVSLVTDRDSVEVGPLKVTKTERSFIPPVAGALAIVIGGVMIAAARRTNA